MTINKKNTDINNIGQHDNKEKKKPDLNNVWHYTELEQSSFHSHACDLSSKLTGYIKLYL